MRKEWREGASDRREREGRERRGGGRVEGREGGRGEGWREGWKR